MHAALKLSGAGPLRSFRDVFRDTLGGSDAAGAGGGGGGSAVGTEGGCVCMCVCAYAF